MAGRTGGDDPSGAHAHGRAPETITTRAELGSALEALRLRSGRSLRVLSRRISEGTGQPIGPSALGDWCRGTRLPQPSRAEAFARLLDLLGVEDQAPWFDALTRVRERSGPRPTAGHVPYPGLRGFGPDDADRFFGRDELVAEMVARLDPATGPDRPALLWVVGPSGAGKSSVIHAGLVPGLSAAGISCRTMTPGPDPSARLRALLDRPADVDLRTDGDRRTDVDLRTNGNVRSIDSAGTGAVGRAGGADHGGRPAPVVVVVDQFEEAFHSCDDAERDAFLDAVAALATAPAPVDVTLVLGLRVDFYGAAAERPEFVASLQDAQVLVGPMTEDQLTDAIVEPARRAGVTVDDSLLALVLRDFVQRGADGRHDAGALPLLAHALRETWGLAQRGRMTADDYVRAGGLAGAVEDSAERVYGQLGDRERVLVRQLFVRLVHVGDDGVAIRRTASLAELQGVSPTPAAAAPGDAGGNGEGADGDTHGDGGGPAELVRRFADARLLTAGDTTVAIAHESLLAAWPRLAGWIDGDRELLRIHRRVGEAARAWVESGRDPSMLAGGARLEAMAAWAEAAGPRLRLSHDEGDFLAASRARVEATGRATRRQARRLRALAAAAAAFALLALAVGVSAERAREDAVAARDDALSRQLAGDARALRATDPALAGQLAVIGYETAATVEARSALLESTAVPLAERHLGREDEGGPTLLAVSADGGVAAVARSSGGPVRLLTASDDGFAPAGTVEVGTRYGGAAYAVALTPDGRQLVVGEPGTVAVWDVSDPARPRPRGDVLSGPQATSSGLGVSADGSELAVAGDEGRVSRWRLGGAGAPAEVAALPYAGEPRSVAYADDGATLAVGDADGRVTLWRRGDEPELLVDIDVATGSIFDLAFAPGSGHLVAGSSDGTVVLWDVADPTAPEAVELPEDTFESWVNTTTFSADGAYLAAGSSDLGLRLWSTETWEPVVELPHPAQVSQAVFVPGEPTLLSGAEDGGLRQWDLARPSYLRLRGTAWNVAFSDDGGTVAAFSGEAARLWDTTGPGVADAGPELEHTGAGISGAGDMTGDGDLVALAGLDGEVDLLDTSDHDTPRPVGEPLTDPRDMVEALAFSPDDTLLAAGGDDSDVWVWDVRRPEAPQFVTRLRKPDGNVFGLDWVESDGRLLLAAASEDAVTHLYDLTDPGHPEYLDGLGEQDSAVYSAVFAPDGDVLAVGGTDGEVVLWDTSSPDDARLIGPMAAGPGAHVVQLAFDGTGDRLAAAVVDGTTWLWDVSDVEAPTTTAILAPGAVLRAGPAMHAVAFRPDDDVLASAGVAGEVRLWSTDPDAALADVCARAGDDITRAEWSRYLTDDYGPPCAA